MLTTFFKRTISSIFLISIFTGVLFYPCPACFSIVSAIIMLLALSEFYLMAGINNVFKNTGILLSFLLFLVIIARAQYNIQIDFSSIFIIFALLIFFILYIIKKYQVTKTIEIIGNSFFGFALISILGSYIIKLRYMENGAYIIFFIISIVKAGDIGAYIVGTKFGKHKIMPIISPKKSLEGCIASIIISDIIGILLNYIYIFNDIKIFNMLTVIIIAILLNILGQIGDMCESLIKRQFNVKDSGKIIPGIGGVFDLIDSLIFTVPVMYLMVISNQ